MATENRANDDLDFSSDTQTNQGQPSFVFPKRTKNPLSQFSSYTYQLSLYMVTPQAYDAFVASGKTQINSLVDADNKVISGTYLVAQSGGINSSKDIRASTNELDYYIDNLTIKTFLTGKATLTASVNTDISFQITEPYGFSFLSDLRRVADIIYEGAETTRPQNPTRQFFVLGVKFIGYDENGNVVTTQNAKSITSPEDDLYRIQDRYYDILITGIKFKITGSAVVYDIKAVSVAPRASFGISRGMIKTNTPLNGSTVEEVLNGLIKNLNDEQQNIENAISIKQNRYLPIRWVGTGIEELKRASIISPADVKSFLEKSNTTFTNATNTDNVVDAQAQNPDLTDRVVSFKNDTPVTQAIAQVVTQSSYLTDALSVVYAASNQPNTKTGQYEKDPNPTSKNISWYSLGAEVRNATWVPEMGDYVYDIQYIVQTYETPAVQSPYGVSENTYYGPYKEYDYWYTGKNSEVITYEQNVDNAYFTVFLDISNEDPYNSTEHMRITDRMNNESRQGTNNQTLGMEAQNSVITSLYDPASFATAKITILGDPDYLMSDSPASEAILYNRFYDADGLTINPHGGQTFIEIDFKEAKDIDTNTGTLKINDKIIFWRYPEDSSSSPNNSKRTIKGISYMIIDIVSSLKGGSFRQVLNCVINPLSMNSKPSERLNAESARDNNPVPYRVQQTTNTQPFSVTGLINDTALKLTNSVGTGTRPPYSILTPRNTTKNDDQGIS